MESTDKFLNESLEGSEAGVEAPDIDAGSRDSDLRSGVIELNALVNDDARVGGASSWTLRYSLGHKISYGYRYQGKDSVKVDILYRG